MKNKTLLLIFVLAFNLVTAQDETVNGSLYATGNITGKYINTTDGEVSGALFTYGPNHNLYLGAGQNTDGSKNEMILYNLSCTGGCNVSRLRLLADKVYMPEKLGINTFNPVDRLHVHDGNLLISSAASTNNIVGKGVKFTTDNANYYASISAYRKENSSRIGLRFRTMNGTNTPVEAIHVDPDGEVGFGTIDPKAKLHVFNGDNTYGAILANSTESPFSLYTKSLGRAVNTEMFRLGLKYNEDENNGFISFYRGGSTDGGFLGFSTNGEERLRINKNGSVGIGTINTSDSTGNYKLSVNGKVRAKEVKVYTTWADFVFEEDYKLPSLIEVEKFIKENGHLKDIPSAKEVENNGIYIGEINSKLLQKIEELTLYTIQQEKEIQNLQFQNSRIKKLEEENKLLKTHNNQLQDIQKRLSKLEKK